ncbi:MAG: histidinol-phosphatase [Candidatus Marinimicrobia bacterium]|nr:histidinol-phosphatase [Candidatus Neomarinimicrobiota bacterium]
MKRQKISVILMLGLVLFSQSGFGRTANQARREIQIPDILGYFTLKCDLHMHTVFSDGSVWPTVRVNEAWLEGLDALSITDHVEYQPHQDLLSTDLNQTYNQAKNLADDLGLILIRGGEITRSMPPGHLNAIFPEDINALKQGDWRSAIQAAIDQDAFLFWNHPGWNGQQKDGVARWYDEHTELLEKGWLKGIEVVNYDEYYPEAHQWCLDKNLTMLGNSDVHDPINLVWDFPGGEHRPMTLVFANEKSAEGIEKALQHQRTVVYYQDTLIGKAKFLDAIFSESIEILTPELTLQGKKRAILQIHNHSDISYALIQDGGLDNVSFPERVTLNAHKTIQLPIKGEGNIPRGRYLIHMPYRVSNLWIGPGEGLKVNIPVTVEYLLAE